MLDAPLTSLGAFAAYARPLPETCTRERRVQIGARFTRDAELCDVEIRFTGPASVVALFRDVLDAFQRPGAPRWTALEALLLRRRLLGACTAPSRSDLRA
jgi:hypothetical protein